MVSILLVSTIVLLDFEIVLTEKYFVGLKKKLLHAFILIINNICVWFLQDIADNMSNWNMFIIIVYRKMQTI